MNLIYLAQNGLSAAQAALNTVGNNLNNVATDGYSRQETILGEAGGRTTNNGFFGYGVKTENVERVYDSFVTNQVRGADTEFAALQIRYEQASQIDDMLGDSTNSVSTTLDDLFVALEGVSGNPLVAAARQDVLSQFNALAYKFQSGNKTLTSLQSNTNTQIKQSVDDINSYTQQLASINKEINKIHGQTGNLPADLLDQRDRILSDLNKQVSVKVNENSETGQINVSLKNGMTLVNGGNAYQLQAGVSEEGPDKTVVSYVDASGNAIRLNEETTTTGKLGGLFSFRNHDLVDARNQLDQIALQLANKFNVANANGYDRNGDVGGDIFSLDNPQAVANTGNSGDASLSVVRTDIPAVQPDDYTVVYEGPGSADWSITASDGHTVTPEVGSNGELNFDGLSITPGGSAQPGDSFVVNGVAGASESISVAITDGDQIAAAKSSDVSDESDNENLLEMLDIKDEAVVGNKTLSDAYASLVSGVGSSVSTLSSNLDTATQVKEQWATQRQSVSGVNTEEEYINLQMYSQFYQANAQILQTANTLFDTILSIK
ncbi:flagellar hook-associated protein FlgK [Enterobacter pasteurii]|uniref:flagellar hook-associated protein FlgK n=1 Tax=Enterobacter pasteurii TaxID=3029761 RepID=UPI0011DD6BA5|nr:flagellar hook-associated protein FlgK [Enterobacter pasteurii]QLA68108.1 flagellar hook-associated protein FlgK [Enterobacter pasteurii]